MLKAGWRWTWPRLEPWLDNLIWLDPTVTAAYWSAEAGDVSPEIEGTAGRATSGLPGGLRVA